jgi:tetratricopeptide (TPR) repeat protein
MPVLSRSLLVALTVLSLTVPVRSATAQDAASLIARGQAQNAAADVPGALASYNAALHAGAGAMPNLRAWIAELSLATGDHGRAEAALGEELRLAPRSAWAYSWLGTLRLLQGRDGEAGHALANALWLDPRVVDHRYANGASLFGSGQLGRAWMDFRTVVAMKPEMPNSYFALGAIYKLSGMAAPAAQLFQTFLRLDPSSQWAGRAQQELASLSRQAPVANPAGHPLGMGIGAGPTPGTVVNPPAPGTSMPPTAGTSVGLTGAAANQCPPTPGINAAAAMQRVQHAYNAFVIESKQRDVNDPKVRDALIAYQCARATLQALRGMAPQPTPER